MNIITSSSKASRGKLLLAAVFFLSCALLSGFALTPPGARAQGRQVDPAHARQRMVEQDLRGRGIRNLRVLQAMSQVPRHLFVPEGLRAFAYEDRPLSIGEEQTISQPYMVALMTELLQLQGNEKVLEVGTGSGYQAAVLSHLAKEVYTIEILPALAEKARENLLRLGYAQVRVKAGDGFFGWEEKGPFDAILITASAPRVPEPLWQQLSERGRLVMPLGAEGQPQKLVRVRKIDGRLRIEEVTDVLFVPMKGAIEKARP